MWHGLIKGPQVAKAALPRPRISSRSMGMDGVSDAGRCAIHGSIQSPDASSRR